MKKAVFCFESSGNSPRWRELGIISTIPHQDRKYFQACFEAEYQILDSFRLCLMHYAISLKWTILCSLLKRLMFFGEHGTPIHSLPKSICGDILECFKALWLCFTDMPISHSIERRIMSTSNHFVSIIYILIDKSEVIRKTLYSCNFTYTQSSI